MSDAETAWSALESPWRTCLELAWRAYGAGTIPVGAARPDRFGRLASVLVLTFFLRRRPEGHVVAAYPTRAPALRPAADTLLESGAPEQAADGVPLAGALPAFRDALSA